MVPFYLLAIVLWGCGLIIALVFCYRGSLLPCPRSRALKCLLATLQRDASWTVFAPPTSRLTEKWPSVIRSSEHSIPELSSAVLGKVSSLCWCATPIVRWPSPGACLILGGSRGTIQLLTLTRASTQQQASSTPLLRTSVPSCHVEAAGPPIRLPGATVTCTDSIVCQRGGDIVTCVLAATSVAVHGWTVQRPSTTARGWECHKVFAVSTQNKSPMFMKTTTLRFGSIPEGHGTSGSASEAGNGPLTTSSEGTNFIAFSQSGNLGFAEIKIGDGCGPTDTSESQPDLSIKAAHGATITEVQLLHVQSTTNDSFAVIGTVALDGKMKIWKVRRTQSLSVDAVAVLNLDQPAYGLVGGLCWPKPLERRRLSFCSALMRTSTPSASSVSFWWRTSAHGVLKTFNISEIVADTPSPNVESLVPDTDIDATTSELEQADQLAYYFKLRDDATVPESSVLGKIFSSTFASYQATIATLMVVLTDVWKSGAAICEGLHGPPAHFALCSPSRLRSVVAVILLLSRDSEFRVAVSMFGTQQRQREQLGGRPRCAGDRDGDTPFHDEVDALFSEMLRPSTSWNGDIQRCLQSRWLFHCQFPKVPFKLRKLWLQQDADAHMFETLLALAFTWIHHATEVESMPANVRRQFSSFLRAWGQLDIELRWPSTDTVARTASKCDGGIKAEAPSAGTSVIDLLLDLVSVRVPDSTARTDRCMLTLEPMDEAHSRRVCDCGLAVSEAAFQASIRHPPKWNPLITAEGVLCPFCSTSFDTLGLC